VKLTHFHLHLIEVKIGVKVNTAPKHEVTKTYEGGGGIINLRLSYTMRPTGLSRQLTSV
jgi:hypothetical protein